MKIINVKQGSSEWHVERKKHIGASDVAVILGINNNGKTIHSLWKEKTEEGIVEGYKSKAMQDGNDIEPEARANYIDQSGVVLVPKVGESEECPFMMASFDGLNDDWTISYETKHPSSEESFLKYENNPIFCYYYSQIQAQLYVNKEKAEKAIYHVYRSKGKQFVREIYPDEEYQRNMVAKCKEFWDMVVNKIEPPKEEKKCVVLDDMDSNSLASEWKMLKQLAKENEARLEEIEKSLKEYSNNENALFPTAGVKLSWTSKTGTVSYGKICKELNVPQDIINKYTGKSSTYAKFYIL
jgi:putative phage-type endonuclease